MTRRSVHYEAAFEDYLRSRGWPYVAVDETKRAIFANASIKSFDFLVYSSAGANLLVDVKGRKFPDSVSPRRRGSSRAPSWRSRPRALPTAAAAPTTNCNQSLLLVARGACGIRMQAASESPEGPGRQRAHC